jgi:hypothetical protein
MYTYGRPQYLVKLIIKRSYDSWNGEHDKSLEEQYAETLPKLKGYFIPNLYLGNNHTIDVVRSFKGVDFAVKRLIAACFVDYMVVKTALNYPINEPNPEYIKNDIDELLFNRITHNKPVEDYIKGTWDVYSGLIIKTVRDKVIGEWKGTGPSEEVKEFFPTGYYYKKRKTKYSWIDDMNSYEELTQYLLDHDIYEINSKFESALKNRHISVKRVQSYLNYELGKLTPEDRNELLSTSKCKQWLATLTSSQVAAIRGMLDMEDSMLQVTLIRAYDLDLEVNIDTVRELLTESGETRK